VTVIGELSSELQRIFRCKIINSFMWERMNIKDGKNFRLLVIIRMPRMFMIYVYIYILYIYSAEYQDETDESRRYEEMPHDG